jgi:hypothetical protein
MNDPVHGEKSFEVHGEWARWTQYEIIDGMVVPAEGTELKWYDPWNRFRANVGKYRTVEQPYLPFMELWRALWKLQQHGIRHSRRPSQWKGLHGPQNEADQLILTWCNEHGLLGLLTVLADSIRLPVTIQSEREREYVLTKLHARTGGIWATWHRRERQFESRELTDEEMTTVVDCKARQTLASRLRRISLFDFFFFDTKASERLAITDQAQIACPNTRDFLARYCESLSAIETWSWYFTLATHNLSTWRTKPEHYGDYAAQHFKFLDDISQSAANSFRWRRETDRIDEARVSAGLLASYALMFLWDRMDGRHALSCRNCGRYFVSDLDIDHARYCSPRCRNTAQKRRSRATSAKEVGQ